MLLKSFVWFNILARKLIKNAKKVAQNASNTVGIYPETKKPDWYHENLEISHGVSGWSMEMALVETVKKYGYKNPSGKNFSVVLNIRTKNSDPCFLQSFNFYSLRKLSTLTQLPLIFLVEFEKFFSVIFN